MTSFLLNNLINFFYNKKPAIITGFCLTVRLEFIAFTIYMMQKNTLQILFQYHYAPHTNMILQEL